VIGEDVERTVKFNQMAQKMALHAEMSHVKGTVLWYAKAVVDNVGNYGTRLRELYWRSPALQPTMKHIDHKAPKKPRSVQLVDALGHRVLFWEAPKGKGWKDTAVKYVVYRFNRGDKVNVDDASKIVAITSDTHYMMPQEKPGTKFTYAVTALDRLQNESSYKKVKVKF
jgi:hypothetical protein